MIRGASRLRERGFKMLTVRCVLCLAAAVSVMPNAMGQAAGGEGLAPGDVVYVNVWRHPDLSLTDQVSPNGTVTMPYVGPVRVAGYPEREAAAIISEALKAILKNPRVSVTHSASGESVTTLEPTRGRNMQTRIVELHNSNAETVFNALSGMASSGGSVSFDPDTNVIILTDEPATLENMISVVEQLDNLRTQVTQVHIEAKLAEVEAGAIKEIGVRWFAQGDHLGGGYIPNGRQSAATNSVRNNASPTYNEQLDSLNSGSRSSIGRRFLNENAFDRRLQVPVQIAAPGQMFLGYLNQGIDLGVMLDALMADNKAEMLAAPYIRTVNHKPAEIRMTQEYPFTELGTAGLSTVANVRFIDIGIILKVTPHVRMDPDGAPYVQMQLEPEVSSATGLANGVPIRSVRSSSSTANVRDGQTLVIGGIVQNDIRNVVQKVPGLGNIPLLGSLFRHKETAKDARELMIFVTPSVYDKPEGATWERTLDITEVSTQADLLTSLEARADARKE